jgi:hypothetical protein
MNLLVRRKIGGLLIAAITLSFWGCREDVGIELPPDVQRTEIKSAEFLLPVTNVYFDSLRTDKEGVIMVGEYTDNMYGKVTAKAFTEFRYKDGSIPTDFDWIVRDDYADSLADYEFVGVRLTLDVDRTLTNDDFLDQLVEIRLLQDSIFDQGIYLSTRTIPEGAVIANGNLTLNNLAGIDFDDADFVPVSINMDETYSNALFAEFVEEGISIRPFGFSMKALTSNGIFAFDAVSDTTELQFLMKGNLYDTLTKTIIKDTTFSAVNFRLSTSNQFTNVVRDRSGSDIAGMLNKQEMDVNPDYAYLNELSGVFPKIDLTPFIEFAETENGVLINRATITIEEEISTIYSIPSISYFFSTGDTEVNINWAGAFQFPTFFSTMWQTDTRYLNSNSSQPGVLVHVRDTLSSSPIRIGYTGSPTVFWQYLYDNKVDDLNGVDVEKRPFIRQRLDGVDNLIVMNSGRLSLGRSSIKKDAVKLKIYYTKLRE